MEKAHGNVIEQVKGVAYSMPYFLGLDPCLDRTQQDDKTTCKVISPKHGNELYYCVIYLAPGRIMNYLLLTIIQRYSR